MRVGVEQGFAELPAFGERRRRVPVEAGERDDLAHQRKAVGMDAGGGEAEDDVALGNIAGWQELAAFGSTDGKAGEIVVAGGIHAGHFGRFAADQRAARLAAAGGNAADDGRTLVGVELAGREIIEEEQRLGALHDEIVDAHGDEVDADGVVIVGIDRDLQLGADAVIGGDENRIGKACRLEVEQPAEAADLAVGAGTARRAHCRLDLLDQEVSGIDVDARIAIGQTVLSQTGSWLVSAGYFRRQTCRVICRSQLHDRGIYASVCMAKAPNFPRLAPAFRGFGSDRLDHLGACILCAEGRCGS